MRRGLHCVLGPGGRIYPDTLATKEQTAIRKYLRNRSVPETLGEWEHEQEEFGVRVAPVSLTELAAADLPGASS